MYSYFLKKRLYAYSLVILSFFWVVIERRNKLFDSNSKSPKIQPRKASIFLQKNFGYSSLFIC